MILVVAIRVKANTILQWDYIGMDGSLHADTVVLSSEIELSWDFDDLESNRSLKTDSVVWTLHVPIKKLNDSQLYI